MDGRNDLHDAVSEEHAKSHHALLKLIVPRSNDLAIFCRHAEHQVSACVQLEWILGPPGQGVRRCYFERGKWGGQAEEQQPKIVSSAAPRTLTCRLWSARRSAPGSSPLALRREPLRSTLRVITGPCD